MKIIYKTTNALVLTFVMFCLMGSNLSFAKSECCTYAGIWIFKYGPADYSFTIVNMTSRQLTVTGLPDGHDFFKKGTVVAPLSSAKSNYHDAAGVAKWSGTMNITPDKLSGEKDYTFGIKFKKEHSGQGDNFSHVEGTWISLWREAPASGTTPVYAYNANTSNFTGPGNRWWATKAVQEYYPRNYTTLVSDKFFVSLFSQDNMNVTVVVSDMPSPENDGDYQNWKLEWGHNIGSSVPNSGLNSSAIKKLCGD